MPSPNTVRATATLRTPSVTVQPESKIPMCQMIWRSSKAPKPVDVESSRPSWSRRSEDQRALVSLSQILWSEVLQYYDDEECVDGVGLWSPVDARDEEDFGEGKQQHLSKVEIYLCAGFRVGLYLSRHYGCDA